MRPTSPPAFHPLQDIVTWVDRVGDFVARCVGFVIVILLICIVASLVGQVFWRYVLQRPLIWPEELARYCFIWSSFLGMSILFRNRALLRFDAVVTLIPPKPRAWVDLAAHLAAVPILVLFLWQGIIMLTLVRTEHSPALGISMLWVYLSAPVSSFIGIAFAVEGIITGQVPMIKEHAGP